MWPPENYHGVVEEMLFMRWCFERNCFDQALYVSMPSWGSAPGETDAKERNTTPMGVWRAALPYKLRLCCLGWPHPACHL